MARAALEWSIREAAAKAGLGVATIARFESGSAQPTRVNLITLPQTYEAANIEFCADDGVKWRRIVKPTLMHYRHRYQGSQRIIRPFYSHYVVAYL